MLKEGKSELEEPNRKQQRLDFHCTGSRRDWTARTEGGS